MGFWITHTHIVLNHFGVFTHFDQTNKDKPHVGNTIFLESKHSWFHDLGFNFLYKSLIGKRNWRNSTHTPCIKPCITLSNSFVILGHWKDFIRFSICEYKTRQLNSIQKLLNHHLLTGFSKLGVSKHGSEFRFGVGKLVENHHSLSSRQSIRLEHIGGHNRFKVSKTLCQSVFGKALICCRWNLVALHKGLCKFLTALKFCPLFGRAYHRNMR